MTRQIYGINDRMCNLKCFTAKYFVGRVRAVALSRVVAVAVAVPPRARRVRAWRLAPGRSYALG